MFLNPTIYLSVIYLTTLSVAQDTIVLNGTVIVNSVLKTVLKKAVVAAFEVSSRCSLPGIRKIMNLSEDSLCPGRDLNKVPPGFKKKPLQLVKLARSTYTQITKDDGKCASSEIVFRRRSLGGHNSLV